MAKKKTVRSRPELDMALEVSNTIELEEIALIENRCRLCPVPQDSKEGYNYTVSASTNYNVDAENDVLLVQIQLNFNAKNENVQDVVLLKAEYIAVYSLKTRNLFSAEKYINFSDYCSVFHVWPYWREFVQRSLADLRLPPLTLPVFKFGFKLPSEGYLASKKQAIIEEKEIKQVSQKTRGGTKKTVAKKRKQQSK